MKEASTPIVVVLFDSLFEKRRKNLTIQVQIQECLFYKGKANLQYESNTRLTMDCRDVRRVKRDVQRGFLLIVILRDDRRAKNRKTVQNC